MRGIKKSRNGCLRCKEKKRKCDERKPACSRCVNGKMDCPGYGQKIRWSTMHTPDRLTLDLPTPARSDARYNFIRALPSPPSSADSPGRERSPDTPFSIHPASTPNDDASTSAIDEFTFLNDFPLDVDSLGPFLEDLDYDSMAMDTNIHPEMSADGTSIASPSPENSTTFESVGQTKEATQRQRDPSAHASVPESIIDRPPSGNLRRMLVDYYFSEIADTLSCFDGGMNLFRASAARLWESSPALGSTIQSMAAICLSQNFQNLAITAKELQLEAKASVDETVQYGNPDSTTILTLIMLGYSAHWHDPRNHGYDFWRQAMELFQDLTSKGQVSAGDAGFFRGSLAYWEMLVSFTGSEVHAGIQTLGDPWQTTCSTLAQTVPHPWTGVSGAAIRLLGKVGRLVGSERAALTDAFSTGTGARRIHPALAQAIQLEQQLLSLTLPDQGMIVDPHDEFTPVSHLLDMGEIYRICGLVQLYRTFPDLLHCSDRTSNAPNPPSISRILSQSPGSDFGSSVFERDKIICDLTKCALKILESIPVDSRTRRGHTFPLIMLSSGLKFSALGSFCELSDDDMEVLEARGFVTSRLTALDGLLPPHRPRARMNSVREVWKRMDSGKEELPNQL